jgi:aspartyl-tRNA(Asn)/glutamyl-tRNA(Gln) amidotransferase subunit C
MNEQGLAPREDRVVQTISHQEALANAPASDSDYFRVPKVVKKTN